MQVAVNTPNRILLEYFKKIHYFFLKIPKDYKKQKNLSKITEIYCR